MPATRTVFMGSDGIALPALNYLWEQQRDLIDIIGVFTQPDRRSGRGAKLTETPIKRWALEKGIVVFQPDRLDEGISDWFAESLCEWVLVMAYGKIIPKGLLEIPPLGFFNLHTSLLPKLRGASPIETAIATGETLSGISLMRMVSLLDAGPVAGRIICPISPEWTASELRSELSQQTAKLLKLHIKDIIEGTAILEDQDSARSTYCRLIDKQDGWLDFNLSAREIVDHIRAFHPWPGALIQIEATTIKIGAARIAQPDPALEASIQQRPGCCIHEKSQLFIHCKDTWIEALSLQRPGGTMLPTEDFLNGFPLPDTQILEFPPRFPLTHTSYFKKSI